MIIVWLFVGAIVLHGLVGLGFAVATMLLATWRGTKAFPSVGGLSDHQQ